MHWGTELGRSLRRAQGRDAGRSGGRSPRWRGLGGRLVRLGRRRRPRRARPVLAGGGAGHLVPPRARHAAGQAGAAGAAAVRGVRAAAAVLDGGRLRRPTSASDDGVVWGLAGALVACSRSSQLAAGPARPPARHAADARSATPGSADREPPGMRRRTPRGLGSLEESADRKGTHVASCSIVWR